MATTIHIQTTVLPGGRVEVVSPELPVGQAVRVTITVPEPNPAGTPVRGVPDLIRSFPPSSKTAEEWEQFEKDFQEERNSWDR
jgi:hypothetical protein